MKYRHPFQVRPKPAAVSYFHRTSTSLALITPPFFRMRLHRAPEQVNAGDEINFTLQLGFFPIHWHARVEGVNGMVPEATARATLRHP